MNILDMDDIILDAKVKVREYKKEFDAEYKRPLVNTATKAFWKNLNPLIKNKLRELTPDAVNKLDQVL